LNGDEHFLAHSLSPSVHIQAAFRPALDAGLKNVHLANIHLCPEGLDEKVRLNQKGFEITHQTCP